MLVDKILVDKMLVDKMLVDKMLVDKMLVDEGSVDKMKRAEHSWYYMIWLPKLTLLPFLKNALHYLPRLSAEANTHCELALVSRKTVHFLSIHSPSSA
jgi:hypothetical protein